MIVKLAVSKITAMLPFLKKTTQTAAAAAPGQFGLRPLTQMVSGAETGVAKTSLLIKQKAKILGIPVRFGTSDERPSSALAKRLYISHTQDPRKVFESNPSDYFTSQNKDRLLRRYDNLDQGGKDIIKHHFNLHENKEALAQLNMVKAHPELKSLSRSSVVDASIRAHQQGAGSLPSRALTRWSERASKASLPVQKGIEEKHMNFLNQIRAVHSKHGNEFSSHMSPHIPFTDIVHMQKIPQSPRATAFIGALRDTTGEVQALQQATGQYDIRKWNNSLRTKLNKNVPEPIPVLDLLKIKQPIVAPTVLELIKNKIKNPF